MAVTRALGVVYTPPEVTQPMVAKALEPLVAGKTAEQIAALRICDPAVGLGAFPLAAIELLAPYVGRAAAETCIVGIDIDPAAIAQARRAMPGADLIVGDALALDVAVRWPEVAARGGFDAVIGNPPYIRQELLGDRKAALRDFEVYDGVADLYIYFIELAHRMLRPGGRYSLVVPDKWLTAEYGRPLRRFLSRAGSVEGVVDFASALPLFAGADAFPCIVWGERGSRASTIAAARVRAAAVGGAAGSRAGTTFVDDARGSRVGTTFVDDARGARASTRFVDGTRISRAGTSFVDDALAAGAPHERARWLDEPWHIDDAADRALIDRLESRFPSLGSLVGSPSRGVITGCNRAFVIDAATRARIIDDDPDSAAAIRPFVKGRDIRPWRVATADRFVILADHGAPVPRGCLAHLAQFRDALEPKPDGWRGPWPGRKPGSYRWYELQDPVGPLVASRRPRLLYQDIQTEPACALDDGDVVPDTTVWMLPTDDAAILAILNSSLYRWYARRRFPPALNGAVRPKRDYISRLPIAPVAGRGDDAVLHAYGLTAAERALVTPSAAGT